MRQLQNRRSALRADIRRKQLDAFMQTKREQLTFNYHQEHICDMITQGIHTRPTSLFSDLADYYRGCNAMEGKVFANTVWKYLVSSSFRKSSISCYGLPQLLACIIPLLTQRERRQLPCELLPTLFQHFWECSNSGACGDDQLLDTALLISLDAPKQSQYQLSLRQQEIQAIIQKAHRQLSIGFIQLLILTLANLQQEDVNQHCKAMLKEIAGSVVEWLNGVKRKIALQLLLLVGTLTAMQQRDVGLTRFLLQNYQEPGFSLALRFLKEQSKQSVLSLKDAEYFLSICPQQIGKDLGQTQYWQEIDIYLNIILHLSFNSDRQNISILYHKYFANRLHHFVHQGTASTFLKLANFFLSRKDQTNQEQLLVCGLQALKICRRQECQEEVGSMSIDLLKNNYSIQFIFLEADSEISDQPVAL